MGIPEKRVKSVAINKKVTIIVTQMINATASVQYLCTKFRVKKITKFDGYCFTVAPFLDLLFFFVCFSPVLFFALVKPKEWCDSHKNWISTKR